MKIVEKETGKIIAIIDDDIIRIIDAKNYELVKDKNDAPAESEGEDADSNPSND